jgi:hypothetical protein
MRSILNAVSAKLYLRLPNVNQMFGANAMITFGGLITLELPGTTRTIQWNRTDVKPPDIPDLTAGLFRGSEFV